MASFRAIPLGIYTLGPPRLPQLEASPELPLSWCCPAMAAVRLASSISVRIFGTLTGFSSLWTERRHKGLGRDSTGLGAAVMLFWFKNCRTDKASWAGALSLCKSQLCVRLLCGCFLLTSSRRQLRTLLIIRCPPSWMNRRTFFTFSSVRLHDGRHKF